MKTLKIMSIIGVIWFFLCLFGICSSDKYSDSTAWGLLGILYAIPFSIAGIVHSSKKRAINAKEIKEYMDIARELNKDK
jgi:hypothetical protein